MTTKPKIRVGLVVPHIFIQRDILPRVIFSPGRLALELAEHLANSDVEVTLFTPGAAETKVRNITADMSYFETELAGRGDTYIDLLKKHPFTFISLARQVQAELIAHAYAMARRGELDVIHIYTNEEDIALPFAQLIDTPVVFTHHDPFNFLVRYKSVFPKYSQLPWISLSYAQRAGMPPDTNWVANIYHGLDPNRLQPVDEPSNDYVAYLGRIIEPKGVHYAIEAIKRYNEHTNKPLKLKIAGKHYAGHSKDSYWQNKVVPQLGDTIEYVGHIKSDNEKRQFLGNAKALLVPSTFAEPFGMVTIESLACGTPVIGLDIGATTEIIEDGKTGFIVNSQTSDIAGELIKAMTRLDSLQRTDCRDAFEKRFTLDRMAREHSELYTKLATE
ncbi:MAG: hypothetical protein JWM00_456 [Candidatus Saccharibacteria bacterium]|nr:hypothetical protein [Candidatus Saccharibacteria bacterium]